MRIKIINPYTRLSRKDFNDLFKKYSNRIEGNSYWWNDIEFSSSLDTGPCDAIVVCNTPDKEYHLHYAPENIFAIMQESQFKKYFPAYEKFLTHGLSQYEKVFSPFANAENVIPSQGYLGWGVQKNYLELKDMKYTEKEKLLSAVISNKKSMLGHLKRLSFMKKLKKKIEIDHFGRGIRDIQNKWDGLHPYYYSIAIENASLPYYFTEKINDCFLSFTIPFYYGCTNIKKFFPKDSFIWIDITRPKYAIEKIQDIIKNENPIDRKNALMEARECVLKKYHLGASMESVKKYIIPNASKKEIILRPILSKKQMIGRWVKKNFLKISIAHE